MNICLECYCEFEPYQEDHVFCPRCFAVINQRLNGYQQNNIKYYGDHSRDRFVRDIKTYNDAIVWYRTRIAPHINRQWSDEQMLEAEFWRLCERDTDYSYLLQWLGYRIEINRPMSLADSIKYVTDISSMEE